MASRAAKQGRRPLANPKAAIDDWLNLVDPDGAFLTVTELTAAFPHGFEPMPAEQRTELRSRAADLDDDPAPRSELRRWLIATVLDWDDLLAEDQRLPATSLVRVPEQGVTIRPSQALVDVDDPNKIRVGIFAWPLGTRLERRTDITTAGDTWAASPIQRAETWCRESGVPLALVTDDDQWTLVWAPRGAPAASCGWRLADLADERILQAGFVSLLGARRFFAVGDDETLERLFERAADAEAEITKGLGSSVRRSVELLVAAISRDDVANDHRVLAGVAPTEVYESAVTVLMRLVFLLFAEERRLLPAEDPLWAESYSVLTLRDELRAASIRDGEDALERRSTAWYRLLATCRAVHGGANHDRLTIPAYGGSLFDPDRFPFLEGRRAPDHVVASGIDLGPAEDVAIRPGRPVAIDDRTVLAILDALLNIKVRSGRSTVTQRVSYKALDVEQIGHCYEGLLDHSSVRVDALSVGLAGREGAEPEIAIDDLEHHLADGIDGLCDWLADKEHCHKTASALAKELDKRPEGVDLARLRVACGHNDDTVTRVLPFWGLIRTDLRGLPVVLLPGSQFVTQTSTRRTMGAQYTTKALAEEVAQYALEPLVYDPGPQNEADAEKWHLRTPGEILDLRVCDPAVGSGAILTAAGRYLADRLIESVREYGPGEGRFARHLSDLAAAPVEEQTVVARREVVDHCLYGVDKNPVAAEMAKLSLWLTTMARERPFTFLDHAIQVGDSLLGITDLEQLRWLHLDPAKRKGKVGFETLALDVRIKEASDLAQRLQELSVVTLRDATEKQRLHDELRANLNDLGVVADAIVGAALNTAGQRGISMEQRLDTQLDRIHTALDGDRPALERAAALDLLRGISTGWLRTELPDDAPMPWDRACIDWPLAFPEVFIQGPRSGFDAIVGNPPFLGGKRISTSYGRSYESLLKEDLGGISAAADLSAHFLRRTMRILASNGCLGVLTTDRISYDDSRRVSLDLAPKFGVTLFRATRQVSWPGDAQTQIAKIYATRQPWSGRVILDDIDVSSILPSLRPGNEDDVVEEDPFVLVDTALASLGTGVYGEGFVVEWDWHPSGITPKELARVRPYLVAADLVGTLNQSATRSIIDMTGVETEGELAAHPTLREHLERTVRPIRAELKGQIHESRFWRFWDQRPELETWLATHERAIAIPRLSKFFPCAWIHTDQVVADRIVVVGADDDATFGILQSSVHAAWVDRQMNMRDKRAEYVVRSCFRTFPFPGHAQGVFGPAHVFNEIRTASMQRREVGLTAFYNLFHDPACHDYDIVKARAAQTRLDAAVIDAYGWPGIEPSHVFCETRQGTRLAFGPEMRSTIVKLLVDLNHERYAAEVAAGLHDGRAKKAPVKRKMLAANPTQNTLL